MNLYTPADGLFGTHVTWADVEEDMQTGFNSVASFGPNKCAKNIAEGNGFMSRIVLIEPDWQNKDKQLPEKFIVKGSHISILHHAIIVSQLAMQQFAAEMAEGSKVENRLNSEEFMAALETTQKRLHNVEIKVYDHLKKLPAGKIPLVKIYHAKKFTECNPVKGYMIMEYIDNIKSLHIFDNVPANSIKQILRATAVIEAMSIKFTPDERSCFTEKPFTEVFGDFFRKEIVQSMMEMLHSSARGEVAEKAKMMEGILPDLLDLESAENLPDKIGMKRVLCHGDLWSMNILWKRSGEHLNLAALIDYQTAHMGCAASDLARLFSSCLSGKDRREHWEELVEEFYGYLKEEVGHMKMPYTLEQLVESYRQSFPISAFMTVPAIGPLFDLLCKNPDDEKQKKSLDTANEKTMCLLEDILYFHGRNMKLKNGEKLD